MSYIEKEPIIEFITKGLNNPDKTKAFGFDAIEILTEIEYAPTADVVPKSEVDGWREVAETNMLVILNMQDELTNAKAEVENLKVLLEVKDADYEGLKELYDTDTTALIKAREKTEVAREIFVEIANMMVPQEFKDGHIVVRIDLELLKELKKKYTEGEQDVQT